MSGIVGIVGEGSAAELQRMAARLRHRGAHLHVASPAPGVLLGSISNSEDAPASDQLALDPSGRLYPGMPHLETRAQVERHLASRLAEDPTQALLELRGSFSLAYWDHRAGTLVLSTDRHGYRTLYVAELPGRTVFASEYKALLALDDCPADVDPGALQTYLLTLNCPPERALLRGVKRLVAARSMRIRTSGLETWRYWIRERGNLDMSFADAAKELRRRLENAIREMTHGHERVGLTLSGGLDSAALLGLVRHARPDLHIGTHTIGYGPDDPEIVGAGEAAAHFGTEHHPVFFHVNQIAPELPRLVWSTEELMGREETLLQQAVTRSLARHERLFIAGNGADLNFCGMPRHRVLWLRDNAPGPLRTAFEELFVYTQLKKPPQSLGGKLLRRLAYKRDAPEPPLIPGAPLPPIKGDYSSLATYQRDTIAESSFNYHERIDAELGLTMACPFDDPPVMEFALDCPVDYMIDRKRQKQIIRAAVADLLPSSLVARGKQIQRLDHNLSLSEAVDAIAVKMDLDAALESRAIVPPGYMRRLRRRAAQTSYSQERMHTLWPLMCAELWMRQFIDKRASAGPVD